MRKINKSNSPDFFKEWKLKFINNRKINPTYSDFVGEPKQKLREALYKEQYGLCCYCCRTLNYPYPNSLEVHIEHFKPKGNPKYCNLSLEYENLHLSCSGYKSDGKTCGHKKNDWFNEEYLISPLEDNVEENFEYTLNGEIRAKNGNKRAEETIKGLGLNSFNLNRQRKSAIYISGLFDDDFDEEKRKEIILEYNTPENGVLRSYCNAVVYCVAVSV